MVMSRPPGRRAAVWRALSQRTKRVESAPVDSATSRDGVLFAERVGVVAVVRCDAANAGGAVERPIAAARLEAESAFDERLLGDAEGDVVAVVGGGGAAVALRALAELAVGGGEVAGVYLELGEGGALDEVGDVASVEAGVAEAGFGGGGVAAVTTVTERWTLVGETAERARQTRSRAALWRAVELAGACLTQPTGHTHGPIQLVAPTVTRAKSTCTSSGPSAPQRWRGQALTLTPLRWHKRSALRSLSRSVTTSYLRGPGSPGG